MRKWFGVSVVVLGLLGAACFDYSNGTSGGGGGNPDGGGGSGGRGSGTVSGPGAYSVATAYWDYSPTPGDLHGGLLVTLSDFVNQCEFDHAGGDAGAVPSSLRATTFILSGTKPGSYPVQGYDPTTGSFINAPPDGGYAVAVDGTGTTNGGARTTVVAGSRSGSLTLSSAGDAGVHGSYSTTFANEDGGTYTLSGSFSATLFCPGQ